MFHYFSGRTELSYVRRYRERHYSLPVLIVMMFIDLINALIIRKVGWNSVWNRRLLDPYFPDTNTIKKTQFQPDKLIHIITILFYFDNRVLLSARISDGPILLNAGNQHEALDQLICQMS